MYAMAAGTTISLYVYDLTRGMARALSQQLLGTQINAVYHTSLVFNRVEYFFGRGVQTCYPGTTHHGQPMEIIDMGETHLPMDVIMDYLESLKEVYTAESYDLFAHNCNNFTNDFGMFLVGKGIPDHITNLPKRILDTPFGQMLKPQIDAGMRGITQAPVPSQNLPGRAHTNRATQPYSGLNTAGKPANGTTAFGKVINLSSLSTVNEHLQRASGSAATIFFTSSTCAPCKIAYPTFDALAEEHPQALFIKVDINNARDVATRYQIRATPTFMTFSKGVRVDEWSGADRNLLRSNVERVIQQAFPAHSHNSLRVPTIHHGSLKPVTYSKIPPLGKLMTKLGPSATDKELVALKSFVETRNANPKDARLPDLTSIGTAFQTKVLELPVDVRFAAVDLLRCAMVDSRVGGFFAEESAPQTLPALVKHVNELVGCPHNLRLVTIHLASNLFATQLYLKEMMKSGNALPPLLVQLVTSSLLDASHPTTRVAAASLAFNLVAANYRIRREERKEALGESERVELAAGLIEALSSEDNGDATKALLLAIGYLFYFAPGGGELHDLAQAMDARAILTASRGNESLAREVASLL